jgi:hypothetical protein
MLSNFRLFATVLIALAGFGAAQTTQPDPQLQLHLTMRNTGGTLVEDFSGKGHFGFLYGSAFFKNDAAFPNSVDIQEGSGAVVIAHSPDLEPARGTVTTWIKVGQLQLGDIFYKVSPKTLRTNRRDGVGGAVYGARLLADGSVQAFIMNDDPLKVQWTFVESPRPVITAGQWHQVGLQWDGKFVRLYIDGVAVAKQSYKEIPVVGLSYAGETPFELGPGNGFVGQFGETRVYSRALSDQEVDAQYSEAVLLQNRTKK